MNRGSQFLQEVSGLHTFVFLDTDELKMAFWTKTILGLLINGPQDFIHVQ